jgi:hypothetical protein
MRITIHGFDWMIFDWIDNPSSAIRIPHFLRPKAMHHALCEVLYPLRLTLDALRSKVRSALCAMRDVGK